ncbi:AbrB/MazE/SpoVT family DNA-binding domain-containing protein [Candidatus Berkelbacteria bacterium]|nr:AbrB/MazE/SpoVT family DNA-binding domain-containing protein [Candidatus Berkelbacteria bacterium]
MKTKIQKWGNSYAVRLPKKIVVKLSLKLGSPVMIEEDRGQLIVKKAPQEKAVTHQDWEQFLIPTGRKKKRNVSDRVDEIVYGVSR